MTREELIEAVIAGHLTEGRVEVLSARKASRATRKARQGARASQDFVRHNPIMRDPDGYWDDSSDTLQAARRGMGSSKFPWKRFAKSSYHRGQERKHGPHALSPKLKKGKSGWVYGPEQPM